MKKKLTDEEKKEKKKLNQIKFRKNNPNYNKEWVRNFRKNSPRYNNKEAIAKRRLYYKKWSLEHGKDYYHRKSKHLRFLIKKYKLQNPLKVKAREILNNTLISGKIKRGVCHCGKTKTQAHHEDYNKPLDVVWLCVDHHMELHRKLK